MNATILIVDDVPDNVKLLGYDLADEGYTIISAYNGPAALEIAATEPLDLILLDIMMPRMDGIEVMTHLLADPQTRDIPVILVTAKDHDDDLIRGMDKGAQDYITKPYNFAIMAARVRSAIRVKHANDQIKSMNRELADARNKAESASLAKTQFLANMSHEIRTPMTAILGYAEVLLDPETPQADARQHIQTIHRNGSHLLSILNDILDLSKIEVGKMTTEILECSPFEICADISAIMEPAAEGKALEYREECSTAIPEFIHTDPTRLRQILLNLLSNAIKFTTTGTVTVRMSCLRGKSSDTIQFEVQDSGIGLTEDQAARVFEPFTQAEASTARTHGGTGLGLTLCRRMAEALDGSLTVTSTPGVGSTFTLAIAVRTHEDVRMLENWSDYGTGPEHQCTQVEEKLQGRILLAEDGRDNQQLITHILRKLGATVEVADNGRVAVDKAMRASEDGMAFDLILMDMQMPELDGYGATRELRGRGYDKGIVALTAHTMEEEQQRCFDAGCDGYATKPIDRSALRAQLVRYLDVRSTDRPS